MNALALVRCCDVCIAVYVYGLFVWLGGFAGLVLSCGCWLFTSCLVACLFGVFVYLWLFGCLVVVIAGLVCLGVCVCLFGLVPVLVGFVTVVCLVL